MNHKQPMATTKWCVPPVKSQKLALQITVLSPSLNADNANITTIHDGRKFKKKVCRL